MHPYFRPINHIGVTRYSTGARAGRHRRSLRGRTGRGRVGPARGGPRRVPIRSGNRRRTWIAPGHEAGAALLFVPIVIGVAALGLVVLSASTRVQVSMANAQWAADAAALAAAPVADPGDGHRFGSSSSVRVGSPTWRAAAELAEANGGRLVEVRLVASSQRFDGAIPLGPVVIVEIEREGVEATAAAVHLLVNSR